jgi:excisionase family DNA binding protein
LSTNYLETIKPDEWISQADAARYRGVTRQAIARLIKRGRLRTIEIGGRTFVYREDVEQFTPLEAGRPRGEERA